MSFIAPVLGAVGAVGSLFGGGDKAASQSSHSENKAYPFLNQTFAPQATTGVKANNFMAGLLGVPGGDTAGSDAGFASYLEKAGYAPALQRLQSGITQGAASQGLLNSGSTQKALVRYGQGLDQQMFNNYFQNLNSLNTQGNTAGQIIGGAGDVSDSQGSGAQQGWASKLGGAAAGLASIFG